MKSLAQDLRLNQTQPRQRGWLRQDIAQIACLMNKLGAEYHSDLNWHPDQARCIAWLRRTFNDTWHHFQVLRVAEDIVAIAGLARSHVPGIDGHIHSVFVDPEFRGYGHGRKLVEGVISYARSVQMSSLEMPLTTNPVARKLYESMGFEAYDYEGEPHLLLSLLH